MTKGFDELMKVVNEGSTEDKNALLQALIQETVKRKNDLLNALCESDGRCPKCFRYMEGSECGNCDAYYAECDCEPLTPDEIINGEDEDDEDDD